jgi:hypothetical protein
MLKLRYLFLPTIGSIILGYYLAAVFKFSITSGLIYLFFGGIIPSGLIIYFSYNKFSEDRNIFKEVASEFGFEFISYIPEEKTGPMIRKTIDGKLIEIKKVVPSKMDAVSSGINDDSGWYVQPYIWVFIDQEIKKFSFDNYYFAFNKEELKKIVQSSIMSLKNK